LPSGDILSESKSLNVQEPVMSSTQTKWQYLERDPKSSYHQLSIKGRRVKARTLYGQYVNAEEPRTIEDLAESYGIPIEAVKEAIAYCETDPPEIREDFAREEASMRARGMLEPDYKFHGKPKILNPEERAGLAGE
jgi:uncharacterized protein (DUF433 family)